MNFLAGKKTYLAAVAGIAFAGLGVATGNLEPAEAGRIAWEAVLFITMRLGIAKAL